MNFPENIEKIIDEYYNALNVFHSEYLKNENYSYNSKFSAYKKIFEGDPSLLDYLSENILMNNKKLKSKDYKKLIDTFDEFRKEYASFCEKKDEVMILTFNNKIYNLEEYFYDLEKIASEMLKSGNEKEVEKTLNEFLKKRIDCIAKGYQLSIMYLNLMKEYSKFIGDY